MADDSDGEAVPEMADEEIDPEMTVDREENVPDLEELLEEIFENEERGEVDALMDPAEDGVEFDLELHPVPRDFDPYDHPTMPSCQFIFSVF